MRIGVLGGTFNPIHNTHLDLARAARDQFRLDRLIFVPAKTPPHKRNHESLVAPDHRLRMVELALASLPFAQVSDIELNRTGPSYTFDSLTALRQLVGPDAELFFILGSDQLLELPTWHRAPELVRLCRFLTVERPGFPLTSLAPLRARLPELRTDPLDFTPSTVSSTDIRRKLLAGEDVSALVPASVLDYIRRHSLYSNK